MEFHERVKAYRIEIMRMQQGELANLLGISQSCLSNYENGYRQFPRHILDKIAEINQLTYYEFMKFVDEQHEEYKKPKLIEQLQMSKETENRILKGFFEQHAQLFASNSLLRDHVVLISKLTEQARIEYLKSQKKQLKNLLKKS